MLIRDIQFYKDFRIRESPLNMETQVLEDFKIRNFEKRDLLRIFRKGN